MLVAQSCQTLCDPMRPARLLCPWDSPAKNTGAGCHALHQEIFPTQGSNLRLLRCRQILYHLNHQGSPDPKEDLCKHCVILAHRIPFTRLWYHHLCRHHVTACWCNGENARRNVSLCYGVCDSTPHWFREEPIFGLDKRKNHPPPQELSGGPSGQADRPLSQEGWACWSAVCACPGLGSCQEWSLQL